VIVGLGGGDFLGRAMAYEHRLLTPEDGYFLSHRDLAQIELERGEGLGVGGGLSWSTRGHATATTPPTAAAEATMWMKSRRPESLGPSCGSDAVGARLSATVNSPHDCADRRGPAEFAGASFIARQPSRWVRLECVWPFFNRHRRKSLAAPAAPRCKGRHGDRPTP